MGFSSLAKSEIFKFLVLAELIPWHRSTLYYNETICNLMIYLIYH